MLNGLQAMPHGGELLLTATRTSQHVLISVTDTGTGMTPETAARVFDAYYTTKRGGTGLGLAMAKRIVTEHHGDISVESEPGKGSRFTLKLPLDFEK
jgi:two-component system sensor histidine kinase HydH